MSVRVEQIGNSSSDQIRIVTEWDGKNYPPEFESKRDDYLKMGYKIWDGTYHENEKELWIVMTKDQKDN